jgi:RimJ/RimL family protein N-acetyltransferase
MGYCSSIKQYYAKDDKELDLTKEISNSNDELIIRKAVKSDAEGLIEYLNIIGGESDFLTFGIGQFGRSIEQEEEFIVNVQDKENALFIIAEINGKIVGNLNFSGGPRQRNAHVGEFGVSVLKEYWGKGIGEELIKYLISWSKNSGIIRKINLRVRIDNRRGISLYKKLGFLEEGVLKRDYLIDGEFYDS